jgi:hypothetical protein
MALSELRCKILGRRSVRSRIALACAGPFLVTAGAFVAATYILVDHGLPSSAVTNPNKLLMRSCTIAEQSGTLAGTRVSQCKVAFAAAARLGAANQRAYDLHELLLWSLVGLVGATFGAGLLRWAIGTRILGPLHEVTGAARCAPSPHHRCQASREGTGSGGLWCQFALPWG